MDSKDAWFRFPESKDFKYILADNHTVRLPEINKLGLYPQRVSCRFERGNLSEHLTGEELARKFSEEKVRDVAARFLQNKEHYDMIMGFHTVIMVDGKRVGRISTREEAFQFLKMLNNRWHSVVTGVTLLHSSQKCETFHVVTKVQFGDNPEEWYHEYLQKDEWMIYPTIYSTTNASVAFIEHAGGCFFNIMGVPNYELAQRVRKLMIDGKKTLEMVNNENVIQQQIYVKENEKNDDDDTKKNDLELNIGKEMKLNASGDEKAKKPIPPPRAVAPMLQKKSEAVIKDGPSSNNAVNDAKKDGGEKLKEKTNIDSVNVVVPSTTEKSVVELVDEYDNKPAETHEGQKEASRSDFLNEPRTVAPVLQTFKPVIIQGISVKHPYCAEEFDFLKKYIKPAVKSSNDVVDDGNRDDGEIRHEIMNGYGYGSNNYRYSKKRGKKNRNNIAPPMPYPPEIDDYDDDSDYSMLTDTPTVEEDDDAPISTKTIPVVPILNVAKPAAPILNGIEATPAAPVKGRFYTKVVKTYN